MAAYTDQEELDKLKEWWKNYGGALVFGVVLGLALLFGNKYWNQYQEEQRMAASSLYGQMLQQVQSSEAEAARATGARLIEEYDGTPYAGMASLLLARISFEANDSTAAREHLEWAVANATDPAVVHAARLRLARLHLAADEHDAALALARTEAPGFEAEYLELQADAYAGLGKVDEARRSYDQAIERLGAQQQLARRFLEMKRDDLGRARPE